VEVDERADIYALGCIMYELILGTPPVRNNSPALSSRDEALVYLEPVFNKMTAYSASERYERLEDALDDLGIAFGYALATIRGGRAVANRDLPTMTKLLRSSNEMHRNRGIEIAKELGKEAVESLHSLLGHARREVRNAAALALGEITDPDSLRYLVAAMYGQSKKAHAFRPSADTASTAIARYPAELRLHACEEISQPVPAPLVLQILQDLPEGDGYTTFSELAARGVILLDSTESELGFLAEIDEDRAWPLILALVRDRKGWEWNWKLRSILGHLSPLRQAELIKLWLPNVEDSWHFKQIFDSLRSSSIPVDIKSECLNLLLLCIESFGRRFEGKYSMAEAVKKELAQLNSDGETAEIF
jgi:serine/threonine protein kinase